MYYTDSLPMLVISLLFCHHRPLSAATVAVSQRSLKVIFYPLSLQLFYSSLITFLINKPMFAGSSQLSNLQLEMTTTTSSQIWRNSVLLISTVAAVISTGIVEANTSTANSCAAVLCPVNSTCKNGKCKLVCPPGYQNCNGQFPDGCEVNTKDGDVLNCGQCGAKCREPKSYEFVNCVDGTCKYSDRCIAIKCATYPNSSTTCSQGKCRVTCNPGFGNCNQKLEIGKDGCEVDLRSDVNNCGKCGCKCGKRPFYGEPKCRLGVCGY